MHVLRMKRLSFEHFFFLKSNKFLCCIHGFLTRYSQVLTWLWDSQGGSPCVCLIHKYSIIKKSLYIAYIVVTIIYFYVQGTVLGVPFSQTFSLLLSLIPNFPGACCFVEIHLQTSFRAFEVCTFLALFRWIISEILSKCDWTWDHVFCCL